jgi:hypothetical protein
MEIFQANVWVAITLAALLPYDLQYVASRLAVANKAGLLINWVGAFGLGLPAAFFLILPVLNATIWREQNTARALGCAISVAIVVGAPAAQDSQVGPILMGCVGAFSFVYFSAAALHSYGWFDLETISDADAPTDSVA